MTAFDFSSTDQALERLLSENPPASEQSCRVCPDMGIRGYRHPEHLWGIALCLCSLSPDSRFHRRSHTDFPDEIVLYATTCPPR